MDYFQNKNKRNEILKTQFEHASRAYQAFIPIANENFDQSNHSLYSDHIFIMDKYNVQWNLHRFILKRRFKDNFDFNNIKYFTLNTSILFFSWIYSAYIPKMRNIKLEIYSLIELTHIFNEYTNNSFIPKYCYAKIKENLRLLDDDDFVDVFTESAKCYIDILDQTILLIFLSVIKERKMNNLKYKDITNTANNYPKIQKVFSIEDLSLLSIEEYDEFENMELFINDINYLFNNINSLYDCIFDFGNGQIIYAHKAIIHHFIPYLHPFIKIKNNDQIETIDMSSYNRLPFESFARLLKYYYTMDNQFNMESDYKQVIDLYAFIELFKLKGIVKDMFPNIDRLYNICYNLIFEKPLENFYDVFNYVSYRSLNIICPDSIEEYYHCEIYSKIINHLLDHIRYKTKSINSSLDDDSIFLLKMYRLL